MTPDELFENQREITIPSYLIRDFADDEDFRIEIITWLSRISTNLYRIAQIMEKEVNQPNGTTPTDIVSKRK